MPQEKRHSHLIHHLLMSLHVTLTADVADSLLAPFIKKVISIHQLVAYIISTR